MTTISQMILKYQAKLNDLYKARDSHQKTMDHYNEMLRNNGQTIAELEALVMELESVK